MKFNESEVRRDDNVSMQNESDAPVDSDELMGSEPASSDAGMDEYQYQPQR